MKRGLLVLCLAALALGGCGVTVVPKPTSTAVVNPIDNSLTERKGDVTVSARVQDLEVAPYRMVDNITSFYITVKNASTEEIPFPLGSFLLIDNEGNQYQPIEPAQIQGIVARDSQYLIPYPYVGYYYLEDKEKSSFFNTFDSSLPYYAENYPQDVYTEALPAGSIIPGANISGKIYFIIDLALKSSVELRIYRPGSPVTGPADFTFPFVIEKK